MQISQTRQKTRARENIIQNMKIVHEFLNFKNCQILSKKISFQKFLIFMIEKSLETMKMILKNIFKEMSRFIDNDFIEKEKKRATNQIARNEIRKIKKANQFNRQQCRFHH